MLGKQRKINMGQGLITPALRMHLCSTTTQQCIDTPLTEFASKSMPIDACAKLASHAKVISNELDLIKVQMGNGMITPAQKLHLQRTQSHQWLDSPLREFVKKVSTGGGAYSPTIRKHLQRTWL